MLKPYISVIDVIGLVQGQNIDPSSYEDSGT